MGPEVIVVILEATDFANDLKKCFSFQVGTNFGIAHPCRPGGVPALVGAARREWNPSALCAWTCSSQRFAETPVLESS